MSGESAVLQVVILRDGLLVGTEVFVPGAYVLGSGAEADLRLDGPGVEAAHAVLYFEGGKVAIQDRQSRAGVFVNGHKVSACEVRPVDEVVCGPFSLKVRPLARRPGKPAVPGDVQALLRGGAVPPPAARTVASGRAVAAGTAVSARRLGAVALAPSLPETPRAASHLRAVTPPSLQLEQTENVNAPAALPPLRDRSLERVTQPLQPERGRGAGETTLPSAPPPRTPRRAPLKRRATPVPGIPEAPAKGRAKLFLELFWGEARQQARCFGKLSAKRPVVGGHDDAATLPLWGFTLPPEGPFVLAESQRRDYRLYVPPHAAIELRHADGNFYPLPALEVKREGDRRYLTLTKGGAVRLTEGEMSLVAYVQPALPRPFANPLAGAPWLALFLLGVFGAGAGAFLHYAPAPDAAADFRATGLPPVAVRLIAPQPKKKEEARKKLAELAAKAPAAKEKAKAKAAAKAPPRTRERVVATAPETPEVAAPAALKALARLSAAGPAMNDLLAAVDKGNGPGSKHAKADYKLSGLLGKAPVASAGLGLGGLGGGGGGGIGTRGAELLRGKGGGGIGALGAGSVGKGAVGGTVTRASARQIGVQGSIDKEAVAKTVNAHLQEVRACYERALLRTPGLAGKVVLEWNISTAGKVVSARTKSSTLANPAVEGCILQGLKRWTFPAARGGVVIVSYPFLFDSVGY